MLNMRKVVIVAKGPTAKRIYRRDHPDDILVGINQGLKMIDDVDYVFMNDMESLEGLTSEDIKRVRKFVIPEYPHYKCKFDWSMDHVVFREKLKELGYEGEVELFNLYTSPMPRGDLITVSSNCTTTTHTAIYYLNKKLGSVEYDTYGFLKDGQVGYVKEMENMSYYEIKECDLPWYFKKENKSNYMIQETNLNAICRECQARIYRI